MSTLIFTTLINGENKRIGEKSGQKNMWNQEVSRTSPEAARKTYPCAGTFANLRNFVIFFLKTMISQQFKSNGTFFKKKKKSRRLLKE